MKDVEFYDLNSPFTESIYGDKARDEKFSTETSPHITGDDPENVFASEIIERAKNILVPMLTIDLSALHSDFVEKVPVLYHENTCMDWVISKLDSDGKICDMKFYDYEENEFDLDSVDKIYDELDGERIYFEDGIDDVLETFKGQRANKNLHIELLGSVPKIGSINEQSEYEKYFHEWQMDFFKKNVDEDGRYKFNSIEGPYPSAAQNGFCYPEIDDSESSFIYVGSYYAYDFGGIGAHYYVFFHPSERIVAQLMQIT